jgi:hypothetical protein
MPFHCQKLSVYTFMTMKTYKLLVGYKKLVMHNARGGDIYRYFAGKRQTPLFPNNGLVERNSAVAHPHAMYLH